MRWVGVTMLALLAVGCGGDDDEPAIPATVLSARVVVDNPTEVYLRTDQCSKLSDMSETNSGSMSPWRPSLQNWTAARFARAT